MSWGLGKKSKFLSIDPDFDGFWFFAAYSVCGKQKKKFEDRPKLKVGGGCIGAHMCAHNVFFAKF